MSDPRISKLFEQFFDGVQDDEEDYVSPIVRAFCRDNGRGDVIFVSYSLKNLLLDDVEDAEILEFAWSHGAMALPNENLKDVVRKIIAIMEFEMKTEKTN